MKIGIVARGLTNGGVARFIKNILIELDKNKKNVYTLFTDDKNKIPNLKNIKIKEIVGKNKLYWDLFSLKKELKKSDLDAVIYPKNIIPFTHKKLKFKKYNIIHDLAYFEKNLSEYKFLDTLYMRMFMKNSCKIADLTFAISNFTKKDIISRLNVRKEKIIVINEGVEKNFKKINKKELNEIKNKFNLSKRFFFYCGSLSPRKNILRVLKTFNKIKNSISLNLYICSGQSWKDKEIVEYINNNLKERVHHLGKVSEKELIALYNMAEFFIYPSLYEGFGLPILEAQACGCPVITSNVTSCPEVAGEGALKINPYSEKDIKEGILKVLEKKHRKQLIKKGFENLKRYSWEKTTEKILSELK